jgi:hypothetical protein
MAARSRYGVLLAVAGLVCTDAVAAPVLGSRGPDAKAVDPDGRVLSLRALEGRWVVLFYEDRSSRRDNAALKRALGRLEKSPALGRRFRVVAVADTSSYDFWPARWFAKRAIRNIARKVGVPIYCDFSGAFRDALDVRRGVSNVVVLDPSGRVRFFREGRLSRGEVDVVTGMLRGR